jgi:hypothetical protein
VLHKVVRTKQVSQAESPQGGSVGVLSDIVKMRSIRASIMVATLGLFVQSNGRDWGAAQAMVVAHTHVGALDRKPSGRSRSKLVFLINVHVNDLVRKDWSLVAAAERPSPSLRDGH